MWRARLRSQSRPSTTTSRPRSSSSRISTGTSRRSSIAGFAPATPERPQRPPSANSCSTPSTGFVAYPAEQWRGELGYLAAISPTVHRLVLEMSDRQAAAFATAISDTSTSHTEIAKLQGIALAGVFQIIIDEAGQRTREGQTQDQIADELRPAIEAVLDDLDRWTAGAAN